MKVSARNIIDAKIVYIDKGAVTAKVILLAPKGTLLSAIVTLESANALAFAPDDAVSAFFKASHVMVATGAVPSISARNKLPGKVVELLQGAVNAELSIRLESGDILVSIITNEALNELQIREGTDVVAVIKASDVMIAKR